MITNIAPAHSFSYASAQVNVYHANVGEGLPRHEHNYTHATVCHNGKILVTLEGPRSYVMDKDSQPLNLPANEWHEIEALEDGTVFVNIFEDGKF
jgi:quercetin dioxygenase-like cupin family protein